MRSLLTLTGLCAFSLTAPAADTITTTDGQKYTKAIDGFYYPSAHVRSNGSVSPTPLTAADPTAPACPCGTSCACPSGTCPNRCPVQPAPVAPQPFSLPAAPAGTQCPGGNCPAPSRGLFFRR